VTTLLYEFLVVHVGQTFVYTINANLSFVLSSVLFWGIAICIKTISALTYLLVGCIFSEI
jgi:hypothetical protein